VNPVCAVCGYHNPRTWADTRDGTNFDCARCGSFFLTRTAEANLKTILRGKEGRAIEASLSFRIRRMQSQEGGAIPTISSTFVDTVAADPSLPNPAEQADNLILWLGETLGNQTGGQVDIEYNRDRSRVGGINDYSVWFLVDQLKAKGLVDGDVQAEHAGAFLTLDGWSRFEELKRGRADSNRAFMAMQFGDPILNRVFADYFKPAAALAGFDLQRIDESPEAGSIPNRMRLEILRARFIVADLSHNNRGAYWEAGYAEGLGKPVIYTCEETFFKDKERGTHFDVTQQHHVLWNAKNDETLAQAARDLTLCIRVTLPGEALLEDPK
jgi:hypothetical protein